MKLIPISTHLISRQDNINTLLQKYILEKIEPNDLLVISSKIISILENQIINLNKVTPSNKANQYAKKTNLSPQFCELVISEADEILNLVPKAILTRKNNILIANAGIDQSNTPQDQAILWPKHPAKSAHKICTYLQTYLNTSNIGVILNDSRCVPMRNGTIGFALATAGFKAIIDEIGQKDLFGKTMNITKRAVADMLASAANYLMGDTNEAIPMVIINKAHVTFYKKKELDKSNQEMIIDYEKCLFSGKNT